MNDLRAPSLHRFPEVRRVFSEESGQETIVDDPQTQPSEPCDLRQSRQVDPEDETDDGTDERKN